MSYELEDGKPRRFCNRCVEWIDELGAVVQLKYDHDVEVEPPVLRDIMPFDLCWGCARQFFKFVQNGRQEAEPKFPQVSAN